MIRPANKSRFFRAYSAGCSFSLPRPRRLSLEAKIYQRFAPRSVRVAPSPIRRVANSPIRCFAHSPTRRTSLLFDNFSQTADQ